MNDAEKILIDGQEALNVINNLAKDASENHRNHAYWKGLRDAYKAILYLVEMEARKDGSNETGRPKTESDLHRTITPVAKPEGDGVGGNEPG